jgi:hypothetical protein
MPPGEETVNPSAIRERALVDRVVRELAGDDSILNAADLAGDAPQALSLAAVLRERAGEGELIACVGVLERLVDFGAVVEALVALSAERGATVVMAVPNDTFARDATGDRASAWGEGAVSELRRLLPANHVVMHEIALRGAALVPESGGAQFAAAVDVDPRATAPVAYVLAFGPRAARLAASADVVAADVSAERAHERARTAELEVLRAAARVPNGPALAPPNGAQPAETSE